MPRWTNPVVYMSRETVRDISVMAYGEGSELDVTGEILFGDAGGTALLDMVPVLFDDRMEPGQMRIEENPETSE